MHNIWTLKSSFSVLLWPPLITAGQPKEKASRRHTETEETYRQRKQRGRKRQREKEKPRDRENRGTEKQTDKTKRETGETES